jgi:hypothetical protein
MLFDISDVKIVKHTQVIKKATELCLLATAIEPQLSPKMRLSPDTHCERPSLSWY